MHCEKVDYHGWQNCYRLSNGRVELIVTTDVGPRVIHLGFAGGENEFYTMPSVLGQKGGEQWLLYGGHRLWHAPEVDGRTTVPDNSPVDFVWDGSVARLTQPVEAGANIQKTIEIRLASDSARVDLTHRLTSHNLWPVTLAPWAITVMAPGGCAVVPLSPRGSHAENLLPTGALVLWAYTNLGDPRFTFGFRHILLRQDQSATTLQKIGMACDAGWLAYANRGRLFVKTASYIPGATYPDGGSPLEVYTDANILELETLAPMTTLQPGASVTHRETWGLFDGVSEPRTDEDVTRDILPKVTTLQTGA